MRIKYTVIGIMLGVLLTSMTVALAGSLDSPDVPGNTASYTLEDIWNRLDSGAAGSKSTFTEPGAGPGSGTMHTLNEIMAKAPMKHTNAATPTHVLAGKVFWGLDSGAWATQTGTLATYPAPVPKTGQTACFDVAGVPTDCVGTGQDGEHQAGVAWPMPRFVGSGDGVVTDTLTGLVWLQDANCISTTDGIYDFDNTPNGWGDGAGDGKVLWQEALDFVAGINDGTYSACGAGYTDWRLANVPELLSLIDWTEAKPALPAGHPFVNVGGSGYYWSGTTMRDPDYGDSVAWAVKMSDGEVRVAAKYWGEHLVWPVRGGPGK